MYREKGCCDEVSKETDSNAIIHHSISPVFGFARNSRTASNPGTTKVWSLYLWRQNSKRAVLSVLNVSPLMLTHDRPAVQDEPVRRGAYSAKRCETIQQTP